MDLVSAVVSFFTVRVAGKPADRDHPFGHGKIETLSSLFEAVLLVVAAAYIVYEAVHNVNNPKPLEYQGVSIIIIFISLVLSLLVFFHNKKAAAKTDSSAIEVNALHFLSDVLSSLGVLIGLVIIHFTGLIVLDSVMAILIAAYVFWMSWSSILRAVYELTDLKLPDDEVLNIKKVLLGFCDRVVAFYNIRTRKSGSERHVDFNMVVCGQESVSRSHHICDTVEKKLKQVLPRINVTIHVEPCEAEEEECKKICKFYKDQIEDEI